jgi:hypothetical protein
VALISYVGHCRTLHDWNLPSNWHKVLSLHLLSESVTVTPSLKALAPQVFWIKLQCPSLSDQMSQYNQYQCLPNETYGELFHRYLELQVSLDRLSQETKTKLSTRRPNILLYIGPDESHQSRIRVDSTDACEGVYSSQRCYLVYTSRKQQVLHLQRTYWA